MERFKDRYDDYQRHLSGEIINGCITEGEQTVVGPDTVWFRETFNAVTYRLVVNVDRREVITGYPIGIDPDAARATGAWSDSQIQDILTCLREHEIPESR